jgi:hypothetical protein
MINNLLEGLSWLGFLFCLLLLSGGIVGMILKVGEWLLTEWREYKTLRAIQLYHRRKS